ncbi:MAG: sugar phosphate nucleotidyltransferase [Thermodesulfobacteriota bacterium]
MDKDKADLAAVILAGGAGTRFWPLSTPRRPKQFLRLFGDRSLLEMSFDRLAGLVPAHRVLVLTNRDFVDLVREQLPALPPENAVAEPQRKDTAAAAALGALLCRRLFGDRVILTVTADHLIEPVAMFQETMLAAAGQARKAGGLYTFGVSPTHPATGYGYLELGKKTAEEGGVWFYDLISFKEKPDQDTAARYLASGRYLWNSGMFAWTPGAIIEALAEHLPGHLAALIPAVEQFGTPGWPAALAEAFAELRAISIDYGVMEKAARVRCAAARFSWSDVGGWPAVGERLPGDGRGNNVRGRVFSLDASDNLVFCMDPAETVALVGVEGLMVVRAGDKTLVAPKSRAEEVKALVKAFEGDG